MFIHIYIYTHIYEHGHPKLLCLSERDAPSNVSSCFSCDSASSGTCFKNYGSGPVSKSGPFLSLLYQTHFSGPDP